MKTTESTEAVPKPRYRPPAYAYLRVPRQGLQHILTAKLDGAPIRLWLALSSIANGHARTVTVSNAELRKVARMTDPKRMRDARKALIDAKVLTAVPVDARREAYAYTLAPESKRKWKDEDTEWEQLRDGWTGNSWGDESDVNHG